MKNIILCLMFGVLLSGCVEETKYGHCVGLGEDKDPTLVYKVSDNNLFMGIFFAEMIVPPIIVLTDEFYCPIDKK